MELPTVSARTEHNESLLVGQEGNNSVVDCCSCILLSEYAIELEVAATCWMVLVNSSQNYAGEGSSYLI